MFAGTPGPAPGTAAESGELLSHGLQMGSRGQGHSSLGNMI